MAIARLVVEGIPNWLDVHRLIGVDGIDIRSEGDTQTAEGNIDLKAAVDVAARLRNVCIGGRALRISVDPPPARALVRNAKTEDARRRRMTTPPFSKRGVRLDEEGRYSWTPEALALRIARSFTGTSIVDACAGCGGDAIAFARLGMRVTAVERDAHRLALAQHNATLYGVASRIHFLEGDALELVPTLSADALYVDAPWGKDWDRARTSLKDLPLLAALLSCAPKFAEFAAKVPSSFDARETPNLEAEAIFGEGEGDFRRVKFLLLRHAC